MEEYINNICDNSKKAVKDLNKLSAIERNEILNSVSKNIIANKDYILSENKKDVDNARNNDYKESFVERLTLDETKILYMAKTIETISSLEEVLDKYEDMRTLDNGLVIGKKSVPLGVILMIFESRPNVAVDCFSLCFKTGNVSILRGGKEAINTTKALVSVIRNTLKEHNLNENIVTLITNTNREIVPVILRKNKHIDVVIPRGSDSLIQAVIDNSKIPVIETGVGNCHVRLCGGF